LWNTSHEKKIDLERHPEFQKVDGKIELGMAHPEVIRFR